MSSMFSTVFRTVLLDDAAYQDWRERPNLFLRGMTLIAIVILIAGLIVFAVNLVNLVRAPDVDKIESEIRQRFDMAARFNPAMQDLPPEVQGMLDSMI